MPFFARFEMIGGELYRFDTRIYLSDGNPGENSTCIGSVVGINPGSARPRKLSELYELDQKNDKLLPYVRNRFNAAFERSGQPVARGAFVQVLNVFYICNQDLNGALARLRQQPESPVCSSENRVFPLTWYIWGAERKLLAPLKERFQSRSDTIAFYMRRDKKSFGFGVPGPMEFAKHTRSMPTGLVEAKLAQFIRTLAGNSLGSPACVGRE